MTYFLLTFLAIYSGLHLYFFFKIKAAFNPTAATIICLTVAFLLLGLAPLIVRISERQGFELTARLTSYIGYTWMGIIVLFFFTSLIFDLLHLLTFAAGYLINKDIARLHLSPLYAFAIPFLIAVGITAYGYFEAINIRTEKITIRTPKMPEGVRCNQNRPNIRRSSWPDCQRNAPAADY